MSFLWLLLSPCLIFLCFSVCLPGHLFIRLVQRYFLSLWYKIYNICFAPGAKCVKRHVQLCGNWADGKCSCQCESIVFGGKKHLILMLLALSSCYFLIPSFGIQIIFFSTTGNDNSYIFSYQHRADVGVFLYFILLCIHVCIKKNCCLMFSIISRIKISQNPGTAGQLICDCLMIFIVKATGPTYLQSNNMQTLDSW